jgi:RNA polymerase sigma factor (TIGR02999 family)
MTQDPQLASLIRDCDKGKKESLDRLIQLVYAELRRIADGYLRNERAQHTLQPTALVHELYARLAAQEQPDYQNRAHFLGVAANVMRQILIDHARGKYAMKRGGSAPKMSLEEAYETAVERPSVMIRIDDALQDLEKRDPQKARLIELRFFGGLTLEESAEVLGLPLSTIRTELRVAQAWLHRELDRDC